MPVVKLPILSRISEHEARQRVTDVFAAYDNGCTLSWRTGESDRLQNEYYLTASPVYHGVSFSYLEHCLSARVDGRSGIVTEFHMPPLPILVDRSVPAAPTISELISRSGPDLAAAMKGPFEVRDPIEYNLIDPRRFMRETIRVDWLEDPVSVGWFAPPVPSRLALHATIFDPSDPEYSSAEVLIDPTSNELISCFGPLAKPISAAKNSAEVPRIEPSFLKGSIRILRPKREPSDLTAFDYTATPDQVMPKDVTPIYLQKAHRCVPAYYCERLRRVWVRWNNKQYVLIPNEVFVKSMK
jgi:hypothetical protein